LHDKWSTVRARDHVTISRPRRLIGEVSHQEVFGWVLKRLARGGNA
jgi:hypothetical protein